MVRPSYHEKWQGNKPHSAAHPANIEPPKMSELLKEKTATKHCGITIFTIHFLHSWLNGHINYMETVMGKNLIFRNILVLSKKIAI